MNLRGPWVAWYWRTMWKPTIRTSLMACLISSRASASKTSVTRLPSSEPLSVSCILWVDWMWWLASQMPLEIFSHRNSLALIYKRKRKKHPKIVKSSLLGCILHCLSCVALRWFRFAYLLTQHTVILNLQLININWLGRCQNLSVVVVDIDKAGLRKMSITMK